MIYLNTLIEKVHNKKIHNAYLAYQDLTLNKSCTGL